MLELGVGYSVVDARYWSLFPRASLGAGDVSLYERFDDPALLAGHLDGPPDGGQHLRTNVYTVSLALGGELFLPLFDKHSGLRLFALGGYVLQHAGGLLWVTREQGSVAGGPEVDVSGLFLRIGVGAYLGRARRTRGRPPTAFGTEVGTAPQNEKRRLAQAS